MTVTPDESILPPSRHPYQRVADKQRRDDLIVSHLPLVRHCIGRLIGTLPPGVDVDNLESAGVLGLVEAAGKFDPTRNAQFKSFAYLRVRGAILDELRRNSPLPQHMMERITAIRKAVRTLPAPASLDALVSATGLTVEEVTDALAAERFGRMVSWEQTAQPGGLAPAESVAPPDEEVAREEEVGQLTTAIEALGPQERQAVTLYYREDLRLREIAEVMNLSVSRISRILTKAVFELGEVMRSLRAEPGEFFLPAGDA